jgi:hypothetical protein
MTPCSRSNVHSLCACIYLLSLVNNKAGVKNWTKVNAVKLVSCHAHTDEKRMVLKNLERDRRIILQWSDVNGDAPSCYVDRVWPHIGFLIQASGARRPTAVDVRMEAHRAKTGACASLGSRQPPPKGHTKTDIIHRP